MLAPRAHEQIGILILLVDDRDPEIRDTATHTLDNIPVEALRAYLGRSDVPISVREFFGDRGIFPAEIPAITADDPSFDVAADAAEQEADPAEARMPRRNPAAEAAENEYHGSHESGHARIARCARGPDPRSATR